MYLAVLFLTFSQQMITNLFLLQKKRSTSFLHSLFFSVFCVTLRILTQADAHPQRTKQLKYT